MKNWKRLVALGMTAMMLASLVGCSTTTKTDPAATDGDKGS
ncbi:MAG TPA: amino acid ABC transporter substrate-binding protein, partial [Clostridiales bacterium]|nr:amino acid ABC transporter substrate-binding protein [Clostridiales bacterium]